MEALHASMLQPPTIFRRHRTTVVLTGALGPSNNYLQLYLYFWGPAL